MKPSNHRAFTLLELVVVLAILAIVTSLAVRALDRVEDQSRFEAAQRGLNELEAAIVGSPEDRTIDGLRTIGGFAADMNRLPKTVREDLTLDGSLVDALTLRELWVNPQPLVPFDLRKASEDNGVPATAVDGDVRVPGGWRGPYLRPALGAKTLLDAWGNPFVTPKNDPSPLLPRLLDGLGDALTGPNLPIRRVRHLGSDGAEAGTGYGEDQVLDFTDEKFAVTALAGSIEIRDGDDAATPIPADTIVVRIFAPDPDDAAKIKVFETAAPLPFASNPVLYSITPPAGTLTSGPRVVRAYRYASGGSTVTQRSAVKSVTLRPGVNPLDLTLDRP